MHAVVPSLLRSLTAFVLGASLAPAAAAQGDAAPRGAPAPSVAAVRATRAPVIDGRLDDAVWASAPAATGFVQLRPQPGAAASQPTEVRVAYDDGALYVAARLLDARPDSVVGRLARRDQQVFSDWFTVMVDARHDRRTAFSFAVNPRGVQRDAMLFGDTQQDAGWDAVWESATRADSAGWTAELRIPLSQLRFSAGAGELTWGVNFARTLARRDELSHWAPLPPDAAGVVSRFGTLTGLRALRPARRLELRPYSVARMARAPGSDADPFHQPTELFGSAGLDLQYGVTSDLTLSATFNPDFGQVEADPSEVNLTTAETYLEEKRPFFTEGADIFDTGFPTLFYSRRIGRAPRGSAPGDAVFTDTPGETTILAAAKLTGKTAGGWSVGLLDAVTGAERARFVDAEGRTAAAPVEPLSNYAVARAVRDFRRGESSLGVVATAVNRREEAGLEAGLYPASAYTVGVDGRHRFGGGDYQAAGAVLGSRVAGSTEALARVQRRPARYLQRPDADHLAFDSTLTALGGYSARVELAKVGGGHWRWEVAGTAVSPGYETNDLGYLAWADRLRQYAAVEYEQFQPGRVFLSWMLRAGQAARWTYGGERTDAGADVFGRFTLRNHWGGHGWVERRMASLSTSALRGGPALRGPSGYEGGFGVHGDRRRAVGVALEGYWSLDDDSDGRVLDLSTALSLRASDRMELSLRPSAAWNVDPAQYLGTFAVEGRDEYLVGRLDQTTASLTLRMDYTFSPALSLQLYAQPFLSAGRYGGFRRVRDPRAARFGDRFQPVPPAGPEAGDEAGGDEPVRHALDLDGDGTAETTLDDPGFNVKQLNSNAVLRWEYRPGSTLFVVWSQGRSHFAPTGEFRFRDDAAALFRSPGTNVLTVKASYWLGL